MMFSVETNIDTDTRYVMNERVRSNKNIMVTTITSLFSKGVKNMLKVIRLRVNGFETNILRPNLSL